MTDNTKAYKPRPRKSEGPFSDDLLDQLLAQVRGHDADSLLGESGLVGQLKEQLTERMLSAELNHHLATESASGDESGNHRNGNSAKTVLAPNGPLSLDIPWALSRRRSRHQAALPRHGQRQQEVEQAPAHLEGSGQSVRDNVRPGAMSVMCI